MVGDMDRHYPLLFLDTSDLLVRTTAAPDWKPGSGPTV
jgi:hypothetical protein